MFETFSAVILLVIFLVPGFVWRTVEAQFIYLDKRLGVGEVRPGVVGPQRLCLSAVFTLDLSRMERQVV